MRHIIQLALLLFVTGLAFARETALTLMPPLEPIVSGGVAHIDIVALNPGPRETAFDIAPSLVGSLKSDFGAEPVTFRSVGNSPVTVPPGGFVARRFAFDVPPETKGRTILEIKLRDGSTLRAVVDVLAKPSVGAPPQVDAMPLDQLVASMPAASALVRDFAGRFLPNLPVYFIHGGGDQAVKFQFSFDYRLATLVFGKPGDETVATLRAGYTQRSLWDIKRASSPFYDSSYMPELAFNTDAPMPQNSDRGFTWLGLRSGFQHESNGKDGTDSRSLNTYYIRPRFVLGSLGDWMVVALPEAFAYIGSLSDNRTLKDYRGYGKLRFYVGRNDGPTLMVSTWSGQHFDHVTYQLDLATPIRSHWLNIEAFIYAQYFDGFGESLRAFDKKSDAFRVGIGLVR